MNKNNNFLKETISTPKPIALTFDANFNLNLNMNNFSIINLQTDPNDPYAMATRQLTTEIINQEITNLNSSIFIPMTGTVAGKEVTGDVISDGHTLTGLRNPTQDNELSTLSSLSTKMTSSVNSLLSISGGTMLGNINMNGQTITGLPINPPSDTSAVSLGVLENTLKSSLQNYLRPNGSGQTITGNLIFSSSTITDIPQPVNDDDIVNLEYANESINNASDLYLKISGSVMGGDINMNGLTINNLAKTTVDNNAANLQCVKDNADTLAASYFPLLGGAITNSLSTTGVYSNLSDATSLKDAVTLSQLNTALINSVKLDGTLSLTGNINMTGNRIFDVASPINLEDAVNKNYADTKFQEKIPLTGTVAGKPITGNVVFKNATLTGIQTASSDSQAINFLQLKNNNSSAFSFYVKLDGSVPLGGDINAGGQIVKNLSPSTDLTDAINFNEVTTAINTKVIDYLPKNGSRSMKGPLNSGNQNIIITAGTSNTDGVNFNQFNNEIPKYMPLSGGAFTQPQIITTCIKNLASGTNTSDAVNLEQSQTELAKKFPLAGGTLTGTLNMSSKKLSGLSPSTQGNDAVNKKQMDDALDLFSTQYVALGAWKTGVNFSGSLNMKNQNILNIATSGATDGINQDTLTNRITTSSALYFRTKTDSLSGNLDMSGNPINGLPTPTGTFEIINAAYWDTQSSTRLPKTGGTLFTNTLPTTDVLNMQTGSNIINLAEGTIDTDAVNGKQVKDKVNLIDAASYVKISGATLKGPIGMGGSASYKITNVAGTTANNVLVNLDTMTNLINRTAATYLPKNGSKAMESSLSLTNGSTVTNSASGTDGTDGVNYGQLTSAASSCFPLTGGTLLQQLTFSNGSKITNLQSPVDGTDGCNLQTVKSNIAAEAKTSKYLSLMGGTMTGALDMNNHTITTSPSITLDSDACNLVTLKTTMSAYVPVTGGTITGTVTLNGITNMGNPTNENQLVTKQIMDTAKDPVVCSKLMTNTTSASILWPRLSNLNWLAAAGKGYSFQSTSVDYVVGGPNNSRLYLTTSALYLLMISFRNNALANLLQLNFYLNGTDTVLNQWRFVQLTEASMSFLIPCKFPASSSTEPSSAYLYLTNMTAADTSFQGFLWSLVSISGIYK
ncbi:MAG: hypothetical protein RRZ72_03840 [Victivallaceae bacterium]